MIKCDDRLIIDVGVHRGIDTEFYLKKGFRVVGIEAHPGLYAECSKRFADATKSGTLRLYNVAIASSPGDIEFFVNEKKDDWETIHRCFVARNASRGAPCYAITVPAVQLNTILEEVGIPYYLKVDIEEADIHCLEALHRINGRPKFVSIELAEHDLNEALAELCHLFSLGYRSFKFVNQVSLPSFKYPNPPHEGVFVDQPFVPHTSGPFGEETPGRWVDFATALRKIRYFTWEQRVAWPESPYYGSWWVDLYCRAKNRLNMPVGWHDLHAKLG